MLIAAPPGGMMLIVAACCLAWRCRSQRELSEPLYVPVPERTELILLHKALDDAAKSRMTVKARTEQELQMKSSRYQLYKQDELAAKQAADAFACQCRTTWLQHHKGKQFFLVSFPEFDLKNRPILAVMISMMEILQGQSLAGDAKDTFHQEVMRKEVLTAEKKGWRDAWHGKVESGLKTTRRLKPTDRFVLLTLKGGPETDWEQHVLPQHILPSFKKRGDENMEILHFQTIEDFCTYVQKK